MMSFTLPWLMRVQIRAAILSADPRFAIRLAGYAMLVMVLSFAAMLSGHLIAAVPLFGAPLIVVAVILAEIVRMNRRTDFATREWLAAFVDIIGVRDAKEVLKRAVTYAGKGQPLARRNVVLAFRLTRTEQRSAARQVRGVMPETIDVFLAERG
jgi:hypothetical protein